MAEESQNKNNNGPFPPPSNGGKNDPKKQLNFYWVYAVIAIILIGMMVFNSSGEGKLIDYRVFKEYAQKGYIEKLEYDGRVGRIFLDSLGRAELFKSNRVPSGFGRSSEFQFNIPPTEKTIDEIEALGAEYGFKTEFRPINEFGQTLLFWIIGFGLIIGVWMIIMRRMGGGGGPGGQIFSIGKSKAQLFEKGKGTQVTFNDVAGLEGAKMEVQEIVDFLRNPKKYTEL
ncbi:MAG TPA: ATP-dependent metallopeptidase FtsH/Yme1/Tma family protein, partial [Flavobacteriales bacterium]